ncbi:peptidyl-prolyl cis-trans isomerase cyclophilin type [Nannochloropsis oceanica]
MHGLPALFFLLFRLLLNNFARAQEHGGITDINGTLVKCHTTAANGAAFILEIKREWAPLGAERFLQLVESGYFTNVPFFRVVPGFLTQFGIPPASDVRKRWRLAGAIQDDPTQNRSILRGYLSFAGGGPNTRDSQLFIALADSTWLGKSPWEVPLGRVIEGMDEVLDSLYSGYGEISPFNKEGIDQGKIWADDEYLRREFPKLDYFTDCMVIEASVKREKQEVNEGQDKEHDAQRKEATPTRIAKATASDVHPDETPERSEGSLLGLWSVLCMVGGMVGFQVLMLVLKGGKSMEKGK